MRAIRFREERGVEIDGNALRFADVSAMHHAAVVGGQSGKQGQVERGCGFDVVPEISQITPQGTQKITAPLEDRFRTTHEYLCFFGPESLRVHHDCTIEMTVRPLSCSSTWGRSSNDVAF